MYQKLKRAELDEMFRQANHERGIRSAATRRQREELRRLYAIGPPVTVPDDSVAFLERLYVRAS